MRQIVVTAALLITVCATGFAQSERVEMGWTGESGYFERRTPSSDHPLQYYVSAERQREFLRAETDDCATKSACDELKVDVSQQEISEPFGKKIIQIICALKVKGQDADDRAANQTWPYWKSIIVETLPGMYREIFLLRNEGSFWVWPPSTAGVMKAGDSKVLFTNDSTSSRDMWCTGEFWVFEKSELTPVDFSAISAAIDKAVPAGTDTTTPMCAAVKLEKLEVRTDLQKANPECRACGYEGSVVVKFKLEGSRAVPVSSTVLRDGQIKQLVANRQRALGTKLGQLRSAALGLAWQNSLQRHGGPWLSRDPSTTLPPLRDGNYAQDDRRGDASYYRHFSHRCGCARVRP
jgi:hypothetical protein